MNRPNRSPHHVGGVVDKAEHHIARFTASSEMDLPRGPVEHLELQSFPSDMRVCQVPRLGMR